jgi:Protein of unknown function (DUF1553)/Protein of unknown function (DUF1549)/Concanavalin A-like lectin/glucanases superfamily
MIAVLFTLCLGLADTQAGKPSHWAYVAPERRAPPSVANETWCRNDLDRFVLARLEREGLAPSREADRATLARRLSLDLLGLPPTPERVRAFVADSRPDAYERLVDELLASPRYGERMALHWLDLARYADTNGYEKDLPRTLWPWRDWVIEAFNADMPFDRFTIEQLAGDLLPEPTTAQLVATGFHRNTMLNDEGGADPEEFRVAAVLDRVATTGTIWLGSTIACAQCHDHKYDPFTQQEFFGFYAFFDQTEDSGVGNVPDLATPTVQELADIEALKAKLEATRAELATLEGDEDRRKLDSLTQALLESPEPAGAIFHDALDDGGEPGMLGNSAAFGAGRETARSNGPALDASRPFSYGAFFRVAASGAIVARMDSTRNYRGFDLFCDDLKLQVHLIHDWPSNGIKVETIAKIAADRWHHAFVTYDGSGKASGLAIWLDGEKAAVTVASDTLNGSIAIDAPFRIGTREGQGEFKGWIDDVRVYDRQLGALEVARLAHAPLAPVLAAQTAAATTKRSEVATLEQQLATFPVTRTMVMKERAEKRETRFQKRGDFRSPGDVVTPATPAVLHPFDPQWPRNRLGLAYWLVDPKNPLLGRAHVNRAWQMFFGAGLVTTPEDFGNQSEPPSHPELLDWLAAEFVANGMSNKALHRLIVTSQTYRQSSRVRAETREVDPLNTLLARAPRFRLDHETIRDNALAIAGLLDVRIGGPSVMPPQPLGIWQDSFANFDTPQYQWKDAEGRDRYRRGLYTYLRRSALYPSALTFDAARRDVCVVQRGRTTTPLQSLTILNDPVYVEAAGGLALRVLREATGDHDRIGRAVELCVARSPTASERTRLLALLADARARYAADPAAAQKLVTAARARHTVDQGGVDSEDLELAAWVVLANVLLNLDETVTRG